MSFAVLGHFTYLIYLILAFQHCYLDAIVYYVLTTSCTFFFAKSCGTFFTYVSKIDVICSNVKIKAAKL